MLIVKWSCDLRMTSTFTVRDSSEILDQRKHSTKRHFRDVCFLDLGSCSLSPLLIERAQYSRSDPSDMDMVKLPLYDHDSRSDLSCSEEDDLETLTFIFGH